MKIIKLIFVIIVIASTLSSCSKNDDSITIETAPQYPMKSLIESGYMELDLEKHTDLQIEMGYKFKSFKNGKITALGVRIPNNGLYRVTLWNAETEDILITKNITSTSGLLSFEDIQPIEISSGVSYFISVNTLDHYIFSSSENAESNIFPIESGNILIEGYSTYLGENQILPSELIKTHYKGMVDFKFIAYN
tara:strand:+ start:12695 stop:13273 length:579 start_codon:yes stop_codon:yes gene_type:complete